MSLLKEGVGTAFRWRGYFCNFRWRNGVNGREVVGVVSWIVGLKGLASLVAIGFGNPGCMFH